MADDFSFSKGETAQRAEKRSMLHGSSMILAPQE